MGGLGENLVENLSMNIGQTALDAVVIIAEPFVIEPKQMEQGGVKVVNGGDILHRFITKVVGGPVAEPALHAGAGKPNGEAMWIMVAPVGAFLECRHPTELDDP